MTPAKTHRGKAKAWGTICYTAPYTYCTDAKIHKKKQTTNVIGKKRNKKKRAAIYPLRGDLYKI